MKVSRLSKLLILIGISTFLLFAAGFRNEPVFPVMQNPPVAPIAVQAVSDSSPEPTAAKPTLPVESIEMFLARYDVGAALRPRIAQAIGASSRKYDLDARLLASIMIVESRADPLAVSESGAIGIMQVHAPTWGSVAESQGLDLFDIEDNIDLGAQILKGYIGESNLWEGVKRYRGWFEGDPISQQIATGYVQKVRQIYES